MMAKAVTKVTDPLPARQNINILLVIALSYVKYTQVSICLSTTLLSGGKVLGNARSRSERYYLSGE